MRTLPLPNTGKTAARDNKSAGSPHWGVVRIIRWSVTLLFFAGLAVNACGQGIVRFDTSVAGADAKVLEAPGMAGAGHPIGNTAAGTATATQYLMQLFAAAGNVSDSSVLVAVGDPVNTRGGTINSGFNQISGTTTLGWPVNPEVTIPFLTPGGPVTVQLRAWWAGPTGNSYPSWSVATNSFNDPLMRLNRSALIYLPSTGNPLAEPQETGVALTGLRGFTLDYMLGTPFIHGPLDQVVAVGNNATFAVTVEGFPMMRYHWRKDGVPISVGEFTSSLVSSYTITNAALADAGTYGVVVTNIYGTATSRAATLRVYLPPTLALQLLTNPPNVTPGVYAGLTITGQADHSYSVQAATNLASPNPWTTLTNFTFTQPVEIWVDTSADVRTPGNAGRHYRVIAP